jgi:hypothetical protein
VQPRKTICRRCVDCAAIFIAEYAPPVTGSSLYKLARLSPTTAKKPIFLEGVTETSVNFEKVFGQAVKAAADGLDEIAGIEYRKALEFLMKDYCVKQAPSKAVEIKRKHLGACIQDHITNPNLQECARIAAWLGNDETHYERIWTQHDINDLKILLQLTQSWISTEYLTEKYKRDIKRGNEPPQSP